jgi:hypothetical protein
LIATAASYSAELSVSVRDESGVVVVDAVVDRYTGPSVVESVHEGLKAEVRFSIQLYREESGISGFLGDSLVADYSPHHVGEWDPFRRMYSIRRHDGRELLAGDRTAYLEALFSLTGYRLPRNLFVAGRDYYLLCKAEVVPVRLVSALGILSVFTNRQTQPTEWVRLRIPSRFVEAMTG